ncbi:cytochrome P450 [Auricularia subglabra TFB-10046 SS5]|nr:cytochrome P450 [Auricularia subglabra TFB-10046 SS5]
MAARTILKIVYNHEVADKGVDPVVHLVESALESFAAAISPGWLVDVASSLRFLPGWLPGTGFLRQARIWRKGVDAMFDVPFDAVVADMANGAVPNGSLAATLLSTNNGKPLSAADTEIIRSAAGSLFLGTSDDISCEISMFLAMLLYPETQRRAQEEIESVTGGTRLPTAQDRDALPYLNALMSEVHRWNPVSPIGLPHKSLNEDVYRDWRIPAGTTVMTNIWLLTHDPKVYRDPSAFNPDRYLVDGEPVPEPAIFGFGRRCCPGQYLADASIWLGIAYTLATFNIVHAKDEQGHPIIPKAEYSGGGLSCVSMGLEPPVRLMTVLPVAPKTFHMRWRYVRSMRRPGFVGRRSRTVCIDNAFAIE